jgi:hypothetical protein
MAQSSFGSMNMRRARRTKPRVLDKKYKKKYLQYDQNKAFMDKFKNTLAEQAVTSKSIDQLGNLLAVNIRQNRKAGIHDPGYEKWMRAHFKQLRERLNEKIIEILRIEPTISICEGTRVRVAVVEIGDRIRTIRSGERGRWREFFKKAGVTAEPVFLPAFLVGDCVTADAIRMAAARLGAGAVLAYTTTAEIDVSPFHESIAVLAFAKCMFIDTRTEYLYFNAEGEGKDKHITLPGLVDIAGFKRGVIKSSVEGLRGEIMHELERLRAEEP